ncbi:hypothetical protein LTR65_006010 [Meristemomyces frigidus]
MLEHVHHRVPVTALAFQGDDVIFSGEGNLLQAYDVTTQRVLSSKAAFDEQSIHGIIVGPREPRNILVWGGSLIRDFHCDEKLALKPGSIRKTSDWILDAALSPDEGSHLALVTAHNALCVTKTTELASTEPSTSDTIVPVVPGSNCILYTAHVQWLSASQCLIASGTAFGDVIIWSALFSTESGLLRARAQTHYTFSAHEGSIFGVQLSGEIPVDTLDGRKRLLASCSDDRTVRLWDVSNLQTDSPALIQLQRDTGFGAGTANRIEEHAPPCLARTMGHVSRIWQVRFIHDVSEAGARAHQGIRVMSFGEDATNIAWALKASEAAAELRVPYELHQINVESAHIGKHIWSVATAPNGRFATGGADGAIAVRASTSVHVGAAELSRGVLGVECAKDNFKAYSFISDMTLVATTDQGRIVMITTESSGDTSLKELSAPLPGLRGYSVVTSTPGVAFIGGNDGQVYHYVQATGRLLHLVKTERKTASLFACESEQDNEHRCDFIVTSCARALSIDRATVILGARNGSIAAYHFCYEVTKGAIQPSAVIIQAHAKEAVTCMHWTPNGSSPQQCGFLHSTGRDGMHTVHRLGCLAAAWKIDLIHQVALPFGPNIEGIAFRPDGHLWVWGFQRKQFVVYNATTQREVMGVDCGGAHRNWAFQLGVEGGTFVWTRSSKIYKQTQTSLPYLLMNSGGHGREIKAVAVSRTEAQLIATGAEDTNIKLSTFDQEHGFRCLQTLRKHNTGIQHLQWSDDGRYLFSSGGFEEFFVWKITTGLPGLGIGVVCESAHPCSGTSDLRVMGFDATKPSVEEGFQISMAYSDSTLKLWHYKGMTWTLLADGDYLTACLTRALRFQGTDGTLTTTATDGHIMTWAQRDADRKLEWTIRHRIHQNAILAVVSCELRDGTHLIITGGDDNAIGITRMADKEDMQTLLIPRAHMAAVTGLALVNRGQGRLLLASASIDQRLKLWHVDVDTDRHGVDGIEIRRTANVFTAVADVSCLELSKLEDGADGVLIYDDPPPTTHTPPGGAGHNSSHAKALNTATAEIHCLAYLARLFKPP